MGCTSSTSDNLGNMIKRNMEEKTTEECKPKTSEEEDDKKLILEQLSYMEKFQRYNTYEPRKKYEEEFNDESRNIYGRNSLGKDYKRCGGINARDLWKYFIRYRDYVDDKFRFTVPRKYGIDLYEDIGDIFFSGYRLLIDCNILSSSIHHCPDINGDNNLVNGDDPTTPTRNTNPTDSPRSQIFKICIYEDEQSNMDDIKVSSKEIDLSHRRIINGYYSLGAISVNGDHLAMGCLVNVNSRLYVLTAFGVTAMINVVKPTSVSDGGRLTFTLSDDKPTDIISDDKSKDIISDDKLKDIISDDKPTDIISDDKPTDIISDDKPKDIISDGSKDTLISDDKPTVVSDGDGSKETFINEEKLIKPPNVHLIVRASDGTRLDIAIDTKCITTDGETWELFSITENQFDESNNSVYGIKLSFIDFVFNDIADVDKINEVENDKVNEVDGKDDGKKHGEEISTSMSNKNNIPCSDKNTIPCSDKNNIPCSDKNKTTQVIVFHWPNKFSELFNEASWMICGYNHYMVNDDKYFSLGYITDRMLDGKIFVHDAPLMECGIGAPVFNVYGQLIGIQQGTDVCKGSPFKNLRDYNRFVSAKYIYDGMVEVSW